MTTVLERSPTGSGIWDLGQCIKWVVLGVLGISVVVVVSAIASALKKGRWL